jgi:hypothetical protein
LARGGAEWAKQAQDTDRQAAAYVRLVCRGISALKPRMRARSLAERVGRFAESLLSGRFDDERYGG